MIGLHGDIPWKIPADFAHFKRVTVGHPLVLGRTTFEGIGKPLPDRQSIVVTRDPDWSYDGVLVARSVEEAVEIGAGLDPLVNVGGGAHVYRDAIDARDPPDPHRGARLARGRHLLPRRSTRRRGARPGASNTSTTTRRTRSAGWNGCASRLGDMELRVFTEPQQGATYDKLLRIAQVAEDLGFGAFFRSDHYLGMGTEGLPGPTDAWTTLAGLARETSTIRLGHADDLGDLPPPRAARDPGRAGRPDERWARRARHRCRVVRAGAHGVRHPVPGDPASASTCSRSSSP